MKIDPSKITPAQLADAKPGQQEQSQIPADILAILNEDNPEADAQAAAIIEREKKQREISAEPAPVDEQTQAVDGSQNITLPHVGGLVGAIADYIDRTAGCYQPLYSFGAALSFCGALFSRWFQTSDYSGNTSNLFTLGVGDSSAGKQRPQDVIKDIVKHFCGYSFLCGEVTSDTALERMIRKAPGQNLLVLIDEAGGFLSNISGGNKNSPAGAASVSESMKRLYSSAGHVYYPKARATEGGEPIENPNISFCGWTTPRRFYDSIHPEELEGGFTARCLVFITDTAPEYEDKPHEAIPERITSIVGKFLPRITKAGTPLPLPPSPKIVEFDVDAKAIFEERSHYVYTQKEKLRKAHDKCAPLYGKVIENAKKVALILACGNSVWNGDGAPHITADDAQTACDIVCELTRDLHKRVKNNVAENQYERNFQRVETIILAAGEKGMSMREIGRATTFLDETERKGILNHLESAGKITLTERHGRGRSATVYVHENFCHNGQ